MSQAYLLYCVDAYLGHSTYEGETLAIIQEQLDRHLAKLPRSYGCHWYKLTIPVGMFAGEAGKLVTAGFAYGECTQYPGIIPG
jgi:hypothetical protein